jgi:hypothetical protein
VVLDANPGHGDEAGMTRALCDDQHEHDIADQHGIAGDPSGPESVQHGAQPAETVTWPWLADYEALNEEESMTAGWQSRGRKDAIEKECVEAAVRLGCAVERIGWPVDLLIGTLKNGVMQNILVEIKDGEDAKLTASQKKFFSRWRGPLYVVRSVEEMVELIRMLRNA